MDQEANQEVEVRKITEMEMLRKEINVVYNDVVCIFDILQEWYGTLCNAELAREARDDSVIAQTQVIGMTHTLIDCRRQLRDIEHAIGTLKSILYMDDVETKSQEE